MEIKQEEVKKEGHKRQASKEAGPAYGTRQRTAINDGNDDEEDIPENPLA